MTLNRRGIELPVSMIVILIVSLLILGLGGGITYKLVCAADKQIGAAEAQQAKDVERRLVSGPSVIIPDATKSASQRSSLCGSGAVEGAAYSLGIRNDNPGDTNFAIECEYKGIEGRTPGGSCDSVDFRGKDPSDIVSISAGQREILTIVVNVDPTMTPGRHVYTMHVVGGAIDKKVNFYFDVE